MDRELTLVSNEHNDLDEVPGAIGAEDEPAIRVFARVFDRECVVDGVTDVFVSDAVAPS